LKKKLTKSRIIILFYRCRD